MSSDIIITTLEIPVSKITVLKDDTFPTGSMKDYYVIPQDLPGIHALLTLFNSTPPDIQSKSNAVFKIRARVTSSQVLSSQDLLNTEATFILTYPKKGIAPTVLSATNVSDEGGGHDLYFDINFPLSFFLDGSGNYNGFLLDFRYTGLNKANNPILPKTLDHALLNTTELMSYHPASRVHNNANTVFKANTIPGMVPFIGANFIMLIDFLFASSNLTANVALKTIEKMSPALTTNFGFLKSSGSIVSFDELRQSSSTTNNSISAVVSLIQKILVNLFSDKGSNRFNTQMGTSLFSMLGYSLTETDLLKEITLAVSNTEQTLLTEQIGETSLSPDEKLKSLSVTSVNINVDVATVKIRVQTEAGTVLTYPITL